MADTMEQAARVGATTSGKFNYTLDNGETPTIYFYDPPAGTQVHSPGDDPHTMTVHDGWHRAREFSLDREGFSMGDFASSFNSWEDEKALHERFYPEVIEFVKRNTGARRVVIFDHTIRAKRNAAQQTAEHTTTQRAPVMLVHCDYTPLSGPMRVRQLLGEEAETLLAGRVAFYNVWKPMHRVEEKPLAMLDVTSAQDDDFIKLVMRYRERTGEIYVLRHSPKHHWWYLPHLEADKAIMLKTYESETDGRARFLGHSAFEDPNTPPDAPARESIEVRTIAFF